MGNIRYYTGGTGGPWTTAANWDGGTLPASDDDVYANGKNITINTGITVNSLNTSGYTSPLISDGGTFQVTSSSVNINLTKGLFTGGGVGFQLNTTNGLTVNITATTLQAGSGSGAYGIYNATTGTINVTGTTFVMGTGATAHGIYNNTTGTINAYFSESYRLSGTTASTGIMIYNQAAGILNFKGTKIESGYGSAAYGIQNGTGTINITASTLVVNSGTNAHGVVNGSGVLNFTASTDEPKQSYRVGNTSSVMVQNNIGTINIIGTEFSGGTGTNAYGVYCLGGGTINITGTTFGSGAGTNSHGIFTINPNSTINAIGDIFVMGTGATANGIHNGNSGRINAYFNESYRLSGTTASTGIMIFNQNSSSTGGRIDFKGTKIESGYGSAAYGIHNANGPMNITATTLVVNSGANADGIFNTNVLAILNFTASTDEPKQSYRVGDTSGIMVRNADAGTVNIIGTEFSGGTGTNAYGVYCLGAGTINITGTTFGSGAGTNSYGIYTINNNSTINAIGDIFVMGTGATAHGIYNGNAGRINAYFNTSYRLTGTTASTGIMIFNQNSTSTGGFINFKGTKIESGYGLNAYGIQNNHGPVNITASTLVVNSGTDAHGVYNNSSTNPTITIVNYTANTSNESYRVGDTSGNMIRNDYGTVNIIGTEFSAGTIGTTAYGVYATNGGTINITGTTFGSGPATSSYGIYTISNNTTINAIGDTFVMGTGATAHGIYNDNAGRVNAYFNTSYRLTGTTASTGIMIYHNNSSSTGGFINFKGTKIESGYGLNSWGVRTNNSTTINITASTLVVNNGSAAHGIYNSESTINYTANTSNESYRVGDTSGYMIFGNGGTVNMIGTEFSGGTTGTTPHGIVVQNSSTPLAGFANITGTTFGSGPVTSTYGIYNLGTGTINVTGTTFVMGTGTTAHGIYNNTTGRINAYFNDSYRLVGNSTSTGHMIYQNSTNGFINFKGGTIEGGYGNSTYGIYNIASSTISTTNLNITATTIRSGVGTNSYGVYHNSTSILNIVSDSLAVNSGTTAHVIQNQTTGTININTGYTSTAFTNSRNINSTAYFLNNNVAGTLRYNGGEIFAGNYATNVYGAVNTTTGQLYITATTISGNTYTPTNSRTPAIYSTTNGLIDIVADTIIGDSWHAVYSVGASSTNRIVVRNLINKSGWTACYFPYFSGATYGNSFIDTKPSTESLHLYQTTSNNTPVYYATSGYTGYTDYSGSLPLSGNVRNGVVYGSGATTYTGSCFIPSSSNIIYGVPFTDTGGVSSTGTLSYMTPSEFGYVLALSGS